MSDLVNSPDHYNFVPGVECIDIVENLPYNIGNALKYLFRREHKGNELQDVKKAIWYIERELNREYLSNDNEHQQRLVERSLELANNWLVVEVDSYIRTAIRCILKVTPPETWPLTRRYYLTRALEDLREWVEEVEREERDREVKAQTHEDRHGYSIDHGGINIRIKLSDEFQRFLYEEFPGEWRDIWGSFVRYLNRV